MNRHQTQKSSSNAEGVSTSGTLSNSDGAADGQPFHAEHIRYTQCKLREAATLDILSDGRFEFGLGAGYDWSEYEQCRIVYDPSPVRVRRLFQAIQVVKRLFVSIRETLQVNWQKVLFGS